MPANLCLRLRSAARRLLAGLGLTAAFISGLSAQETDGPVFELDPLEVRAISDGQRRALLEQRDAANIINVVSADAMGRFPDPNIAEALQRLPGIGIERDQGEGRFINVRGAPKEFSSVTIDGISIPASEPGSRAIALDIFASDFASQIEVTKALRPNQDADAIAGTVNVTSPSALAIGQRRILGSLAGSYNNNGGTNDTRASLFYSDVFGTNNQFGIVLGVNYSKTRREVDNVEHEGWDTSTSHKKARQMEGKATGGGSNILPEDNFAVGNHALKLRPALPLAANLHRDPFALVDEKEIRGFLPAGAFQVA